MLRHILFSVTTRSAAESAEVGFGGRRDAFRVLSVRPFVPYGLLLESRGTGN